MLLLLVYPCHWVCTSGAIIGAASGHSPNMTKPLKASLPKLFLHWHHPRSLQDVSFLNLIPQGDPQDVRKAMHLKRLQLMDVMLGDSPCLCSIEEHRQHQSSEDVYFSSNTEGSTANTFLLHIWYTLPAFSSLADTSRCTLIDWAISLPREGVSLLC